MSKKDFLEMLEVFLLSSGHSSTIALDFRFSDADQFYYKFNGKDFTVVSDVEEEEDCGHSPHRSEPCVECDLNLMYDAP
jgi:hypothetical protein